MIKGLIEWVSSFLMSVNWARNSNMQGLNSVGAGGSWDPTPCLWAPIPHTDYHTLLTGSLTSLLGSHASIYSSQTLYFHRFTFATIHTRKTTNSVMSVQQIMTGTISTAECERGFSRMELICTPLRLTGSDSLPQCLHCWLFRLWAHC